MRKNERCDSSDNTLLERALPLTRRQALHAAAFAAGSLLVPRFARADDAFTLSGDTVKALEKSPLIYVSPLDAKGEESTCHGEVWFMHDEGSVLMMTGTKTWKAKALRTGLDTVRIWVGDFGTVKQAGERYREAPGFKAKATRELDKAAFDRLTEAFSEKYSAEWGKWGPRFKKGWDDGSRTLIRYTPVSA